MEKYVYSVGLIPVQEWIAQARRSRDLRAGSVFLWQTLAPLLARLDEEGEIWLPSPPAGGFAELAGLSFAKAFTEARYGIPHRASGVLEANEEEDVRTLFAELEGCLVASWIRFRDSSLAEPRFDARAYWQDLDPVWQAYRAAHADGADCPFHLVWVARPVPFPLEDRAANLEAIDRLYDEVKRARPLRAWRSGSAAGKCNQCGQREAVGPGTSFEAWRSFHLRHEQDRWIREGVRLDPGERLCFVCLAKRMAGYEAGDGRFPSTGEIAAASWLAKAEELAGESSEDGKILRQALARLRQSRLGGRDLGRALYASDNELERLGLDKGQRQEILEPRKQLGQAVGAEPPGYLALLTFDGDDMGRHMQEDSQRLSGLLADFAAAASRLLETARGRAFYLAGDEGLAMVPADRALGLALDLRDAFKNIAAGGGDRPTLSVGIAFFEQSRPMRGAIQAARGALRAAKEQPGKNALGVAVETASGNRWSFTAPWGDDWTRVGNAVRLIQKGNLSPGWAYDAERFLTTIPESEWNDGDVVAAARAEVRRLFLRRVRPSKVDETETDKEDGEEETRLARKKALWRELPGESWWPRDEESGLLARSRPEQFHLIGFLARQRAVPVKEEA